MGRYSRHEPVLEALRVVRTRLATQRLRRPASTAATTRHKLAQRLQPETVTQLVTDYEGGSPTRALAERYEVSITSVKMLLHMHGAQLRPYRPVNPNWPHPGGLIRPHL